MEAKIMATPSKAVRRALCGIALTFTIIKRLNDIKIKTRIGLTNPYVHKSSAKIRYDFKAASESI